jgi:hypothetical protein
MRNRFLSNQNGSINNLRKNGKWNNDSLAEKAIRKKKILKKSKASAFA